MPQLRAAELAVIADKAQARLALCEAPLAAELEAARETAPCLERVMCYGPDAELERAMSAKDGAFDAADTAADDVCVIAFTSGTTGVPKGTCHFHRDVLVCADGYAAEVVEPRADDRFIGSPPLAFTFGLGGLVVIPLRFRACSVLLGRATPEHLAEAVARHRATVLFAAPTAYRQMLVRADAHAFRTLRCCISAGETLPLPSFEAWERRMGQRIIDGIGTTEMFYTFIASPLSRLAPGTTGRPVAGYEARILDDDGGQAPDGTPGRLAVRGPTGCRYLADARQRDYVVDGWNVTGDTFVRDENGLFRFCARNDDMIITSGYNVAGPEVEAALMAHEAVAECAVVAAPDAERGHVIMAYVVPREPPADPASLASTLQAHARASIAPYKYPRRIEFIDALPKTGTGKVQRYRLRELAAGHEEPR